jgi:dTDP-4-amino-4,6-dideoxygalactose transaminase
MAQGAHKITEQFEQELCKYTGSPYAIAVDNCSNALFLALYYELNVKTHKFAQFIYEGKQLRPIITIPKHTYPSVPCEIIHAGGKVEFDHNSKFCSNSYGINGVKVEGSYQLLPTNIWDSALSFTHNMYQKGQHMCVSFTGPYKHLKLGKGGAILTDDINAYYWFKRARFSGRSECSYHDDDFDSTVQKDADGYEVATVTPIAGWNFYMMPEIAARGLLLMHQFYDRDGKPKSNEDLCLPYPDLSKFKTFQQ